MHRQNGLALPIIMLLGGVGFVVLILLLVLSAGKKTEQGTTASSAPQARKESNQPNAKVPRSSPIVGPTKVFTASSFNLTYPSTWNVSTNSNVAGSTAIMFRENATSLPSLFIQVVPISQLSTANLNTVLTKAAPKKTSVSIDGVQASQYTLGTTGQLTEQKIVFEKQGQTYLLVYSYQGEEQANEKRLRQILQSLHFR